VGLGQETVALVGPSGAGKSSVLRAIAGLLAPAWGRIRCGDRMLLDTERGTSLPPERRRVGMVFQDAALFPHLTVAGNVAYGLPSASRRHRRDAVRPVLERFGLARLEGVRPTSLSGGERRRVAVARALASRPELLLLDEPLSSLDPVSKAAVASELSSYLREMRMPTVLVSHDFSDVLGLADRVAVMESGRILQEGTARELLEAPASSFVASLTGVNYFEAVALSRGDLTEIRATAGVVLASADPAFGAVGVVVYPWDVALSLRRPEGSALNSMTGPIGRVTELGNRVRVTVASDPPIVAEVTEGSARRLGLAPGVRVVATWKATATRLVPKAGGPGRGERATA